MLSAFVVWLRSQLVDTPEGRTRWTQITTWVDTPPARVIERRAAAAPTASTTTEESAAFAAFASAAGGG